MIFEKKLASAQQKFNSGKLDEAEIIINELKQSINSKSNSYPVQILEAAIKVRTGKVDEALLKIEKIEKTYGDKPEVINIKAVGIRAQKNFKLALQILKEGSIKHPQSFDIAHNLSTTAADLGEYNLAEEAGLNALKINPQSLDTLKNLGRVYVTTRNVSKTEEVFKKLESIVGKTDDVLIGYGAAKLIESKYEIASKYFKDALAINPKIGPAWANLGICQKFAGDYIGALKSLELARFNDPDQIEHQWNLSLIQLALGDYKNGWKNYESRYNEYRIAPDRVISPKTSIKMLKNSDNIKEKTILLLQEQGFGDTFQFFRFARNLKDEGAKKIIAMVGNELLDVVRSMPWIDEVRTELKQSDGILPNYWVFPMSLPARYEISSKDKLAKDVPYIAASAIKKFQWDEKLTNATHQKLRVGLVWAGRETHSNDKNRSIKLSQLGSFSELEDKIEFISLQKGVSENQESPFKNLHKLGSQIQTFDDTAAILANLDLLISVDSAPVHIAGAMGLPTWVLLPSIFDFRWMVDRNDTPWYPSVRLFRQAVGEDWSNPIAKIVQELRDITTKKQSWTAKVYQPHETVLAKTSFAGYELLIRSAYQYQIEGNMHEAVRLYESSREIHNDNPEILRNLASAYRSIGDLPNAINTYHYAENSGYIDHITHINFGNLLVQMQDFSRALGQAEAAIVKKENYRMAWEMKALCLEKLGMNAEAQAAMGRAQLCTE